MYSASSANIAPFPVALPLVPATSPYTNTAESPASPGSERTPAPTVATISGVSISNCDFGSPVAAGPATVTSPGPIYAFNVSGLKLSDTLIGGAIYNTTISDHR